METVMQFGFFRVSQIKIVIALFFSLSVVGCAAFPSSDQVVKINITGLNYPHAEIVFRVDTPNESDLDIFLTEHYAIRIGLEWLKIQEQPSDADTIWFDANPSGPLVPWITCKYHF
jgi:hypothetical protein